MRVISILTALIISLTTASLAQDVANGEAIYKKKCKGCHRLSEGVKMGPGLKGVTKIRTDKWLHKWLQHPKAMIESGDPVSVELKKKYKKTMRKLKEMQSEQNRNDVIAFLKKNDEAK